MMAPKEPKRLLADRLQGTSLYLVGMMGSGKSTVGRYLAQRLGYQFFDTDQVIEQATGQGIPEIFAQQGESAFRDLETQVLADLCRYPRLVVATGGGIVQRSTNWGYLQHGVVVWLDVDLAVLAQRLRSDDDSRPLLNTPNPRATIADILAKRRRFYAQADVHVRIDEAVAVTMVADWVEAQVMRRLRDPEMHQRAESFPAGSPESFYE